MDKNLNYGAGKVFTYERKIIIPITDNTYYILHVCQKYGTDIKILWYPDIVKGLIINRLNTIDCPNTYKYFIFLDNKVCIQFSSLSMICF